VALAESLIVIGAGIEAAGGLNRAAAVIGATFGGRTVAEPTAAL
jgi:hypothetical protein